MAAIKKLLNCREARSTVSEALAVSSLGLAVLFGMASPSNALPSFARQTGQTCSACHTAFPQLTPFGRRFKLGGYTLEGGDHPDTPPLAMMVQSGFTHFNGAPGPQGGGFNDSNNFVDLAQQISVFYGGKIFGNVGAFIQMTYSNNSGRSFTLDNTDIRYADTTKLFGQDVLYGLTANNNPSVQDVWNTTPAWSSPFIGSNFQITPSAATMLENLNPDQMLGAGGYIFVNDTYYAELSAYGSTAARTQTTLGLSPPQLGYNINGIAPYWRLAAEPVWGDHAFMIGAYGMAANIRPNDVYGFDFDKYLDLGFDTQYQWISEMHAVTLRGNYLFERQILNSTFAQGGSSNPVNYLRSLKLSGEYVYDHTYAATLTYFQLTGSADAMLLPNNLMGSPNSNGWIFDVAYLPFSKGGPSFWPWLNTRIGLSYTLYNTFDGGAAYNPVSGRSAKDNGVLMLYAFTAF